MKQFVAKDILTRIEGHGSIELIKRGDQIIDVRFHLHESPRLFEKLLVGRRYDEVADIACRICSICSTVHKVASLTAMEAALGIQVSKQTRTMRRLAVLGGIIESHALHLFCLILPDYRKADGFSALADTVPEELAGGLAIKAFGNLLQESVGGRAIHPFNLLPGGLGRIPTVQQFQLLAEKLNALEKNISDLMVLCRDLPAIIPPLPAVASAAADKSGMGLITSHGESVAAEKVVSWIQQEQEPYSNALFTLFDRKELYQVGPLARQKLAGNIAENISVSASTEARGMELRQAMDETRTTINNLLDNGVYAEKPAPVKPGVGEGLTLIEAPRGTLIHRYCFDENGICTAATVITPTAINQGAIENSLKCLIEEMKDQSEADIRTAAEHLVRLFDPCISCAVH